MQGDSSDLIGPDAGAMEASGPRPVSQELFIAGAQRINEHPRPTQALQNVRKRILARIVSAHLDEEALASEVERLKDAAAFFEVWRFQVGLALGEQIRDVLGRVHFRERSPA